MFSWKPETRTYLPTGGCWLSIWWVDHHVGIIRMLIYWKDVIASTTCHEWLGCQHFICFKMVLTFCHFWVHVLTYFVCGLHCILCSMLLIKCWGLKRRRKDRRVSTGKRMTQRADTGQFCIKGAHSSAGTKGISNWKEKTEGGCAHNCESASGTKSCDWESIYIYISA